MASLLSIMPPRTPCSARCSAASAAARRRLQGRCRRDLTAGSRHGASATEVPRGTVIVPGPGSGGSGIALVPSASPNPALPISCALMAVILVPTTDRKLSRGVPHQLSIKRCRTSGTCALCRRADAAGPEPTDLPGVIHTDCGQWWILCASSPHSCSLCAQRGQPSADLLDFRIPAGQKVAVGYLYTRTRWKSVRIHRSDRGAQRYLQVNTRCPHSELFAYYAQFSSGCPHRAIASVDNCGQDVHNVPARPPHPPYPHTDHKGPPPGESE